MKIFRIVRRQYAILGISPSNESTQRLSFSERVLAGILFYEYIYVSQFLYIFHMANGFMEYMECISSISGTIVLFICFVAIAFKRDSLFDSIDTIEKLIDTRYKYPKSEAFFFKTCQQVERWSEIIFNVSLKLIVQIIVLPKCIVSFFTYFITDSGNDSFQLPFPVWFPFDWNNPIGYSIAVIIEYTIIGYEFFVVACTLGLAYGAFWFAISATKEIQDILCSINEKAHAKENQSNEMMVLFTEFIDAHGIVMQVEHDFSDIFQPIFMTYFTYSLLAISSAMLIFQVEILHHGDVILVLLNATLNGLLALAAVFIACELGQRLSDAFDEIKLTIDQFDWYLFPIEIQRMLPVIMVIVQQPVQLECFGSFACSREVFKNIIHRAYSYFMVLRQLGD